MTQVTSSSASDSAVSVKNLKKGFGKFQIHKGVNLEIPRGKITYIMGGSGEGKSLLLKQIMGFIRPDSGSIEINGQPIHNIPEHEINKVRRSMGILFQHGALFDSLSVYENVAFALKEQLRLSKSEIDTRVEELVKSVGLTMAHTEKMPSELSGGQRKRIALARAIALKPSIMMYDEPTTGLDPLTTEMVTQLIKRTNEQHNLTTIVISHDTHVAFDVAQQVAFLKDGEIRYFGSPKKIFESDNEEIKKFFALEASRKGLSK